jgi:hypothetical protein
MAIAMKAFAELPMLEVISLEPAADIDDSCRRLEQMGFGSNAG